MSTDMEVHVAPEPGGELDNKRMQGGIAVGNSVMAPAQWQMLAAMAETVYNTPFVPAGLRGNKASTLACLLYGDSMGIPPMVALKEISVIDGNPTMSAALMVAKVLDEGHTIRREEQRDGEGNLLGVTAHGTRKTGETDSFTFTLEMAARAGLLTKKNWQHYPEAMCWHRASSQLCTFLFPDVFMGSPYVPEELGAADTDPLTGQVLEAVPAPETVEGAPEAAERPAGDPGAAGEPDGAETGEVVDQHEPEPAPLEAEVVEATPVGGIDHDAYDEAREEQIREVAQAERERTGEAAEAEQGWTPMDARTPTDDEYTAAKAALAAGVDDQEERELLEMLVNVFEAETGDAIQPELFEQTRAIVSETIPDVLVYVDAAVQRGDRDFIRGVLAHEQAKEKPRPTLVAMLEDRIKLVDDAGAQEKTDDAGDGQATLAPFEETDHAGKVTWLLAAITLLNDQKPDDDNWKLTGVLLSANKIWNLNVTRLEELSDDHLGKIWNAVPRVTRGELAEYLEGGGRELIETFASKVKS